jgi:hypothetical protein
MLPTLKPGQDILSFNWAYLGKEPKIGDIVILKFEGKDLVKRVKKIDGEKVFVEGDNKEDSLEVGQVDKSQIIGKVIYQTVIPAKAGIQKLSKNWIPNQVGDDKLIPCPACGGPVIGVYGRKDAICKNCGFKLSCCGEP